MSGRGHDVLQLRPAQLEDPDSLALVAQVQQEYTTRYGGPDEAPLVTGELDPPGGAFFLGYAEGVPVAMGGWRRRPDVPALGRTQTVEVKRMYVAPAARRRGFARQVLVHLERTARAAGADVVVLETGTMQPEAIELYTRAGYELIPDYGYYAWSPLSRCFAKAL